MAGPGNIAWQVPPGPDDIQRRLRALEQAMTELRAARTLESAAIGQGGLTVVGGKIEIQSGGELIVDGPASVGGTLDVTGDATFGGTLDVTGDAVFSGNLAVPNGSITNDALENPIVSGIPAAPGAASSWGVTTSFVTKSSTSIAVPAGYSQALVCAIGSATVTDPTGPNRFDVRCGIGSDVGAALPNLANTSSSTSVAHTVQLTGLSGGTILLSVQVFAAVAIAGNTGNIATVTGFAMFFR